MPMPAVERDTSDGVGLPEIGPRRRPVMDEPTSTGTAGRSTPASGPVSVATLTVCL